MKKIISFLVIAAVVAAGQAALGNVKPNTLFSDGTVLQQGMNVPVWGTADPGEKVTVKFQNQTVSDISEDGKWMVKLKPLKVGGPYNMTISGKNTVEIKDVLVGEVWICSGQSNMQMALNSVENAEKAIAASTDPNIHLFSVPLIPADTPQAEVAAKWYECNPQTVPGFSAVGYFFGRDLRKVLNVPVGIINTSYGGTRVEAWTSARVLKNDPDWENLSKVLPEWAKSPNRACVLYNGMIAPLVPFAIRGAIWYQGESNAGNAYLYRTRFPAMIRNWREDWGEGNFPFFFVQLAPFQKVSTEPEESAWAELREAQLLTTKTCPNTAMAVITDVGDPVDIHPKKKEPVGARLALAALATTYGKPVAYLGPTYKSMEVRGDRAILTFENASGGLEARGGDLTGFTVAGADKKFYNARASIFGNRVIVSSPQVSSPVAVRYGWANCPVVNLYDKEGLPASPFRTDDFQMLTAPKTSAQK